MCPLPTSTINHIFIIYLYRISISIYRKYIVTSNGTINRMCVGMCDIVTSNGALSWAWAWAISSPTERYVGRGRVSVCVHCLRGRGRGRGRGRQQ